MTFEQRVREAVNIDHQALQEAVDEHGDSEDFDELSNQVTELFDEIQFGIEEAALVFKSMEIEDE